MCNLVARFYDPTSGSIELDGRDLRDIDVHSYRSLLGVVEQDVFLFDGTIEDNIRYARRGASTVEVVEAARAAHAHEFIMELENQYQTVIGERGVKLSGGQRQRLAIARALLADPRILILDEATSNLDTESERYIQNSLSTLLRGPNLFCDRTSHEHRGAGGSDPGIGSRAFGRIGYSRGIDRPGSTLSANGRVANGRILIGPFVLCDLFVVGRTKGNIGETDQKQNNP